MTYEEAFRLGTVCDGYIKCTFAEIFDADRSQFLFSLQKAHTVNKALQEFKEQIGREDVVMTYMIPVIQAKEGESVTLDDQRSRGKWVTAKLTPQAMDIIIACINRKKILKYPYNERWRELSEILTKSGDVSVRKDAIDWIPTNFKNATVDPDDPNDPNSETQLNLTIALDKAKKELDQAKALLVTTAGATMIL